MTLEWLWALLTGLGALGSAHQTWRAHIARRRIVKAGINSLVRTVATANMLMEAGRCLALSCLFAPVAVLIAYDGAPPAWFRHLFTWSFMAAAALMLTNTVVSAYSRSKGLKHVDELKQGGWK